MGFIVLGLILSLAVIFFQDLKWRHIHVIFPLIIFALSLYSAVVKKSLAPQMYLWNPVFFIIVLSILILYMSIKHRKVINPFSHYFGLGDLLFFLAVTPLFLLHNYVLYFIFSMLFSIVLQQFLKKYMKHQTVPLAGFSALLLLLIIVKDIFLEFNKMTLL